MELCILGYMLDKHNMRFINEEVFVVSGKAKGADTLGERFAKHYCKDVKPYPADWNNLVPTKDNPVKIRINKGGFKYNVLAGFNRNKQMAIVSDIIFIFWDGVSKGTKDMIDVCNQLNKKVVVFNY
jgi:hypothetical protein